MRIAPSVELVGIDFVGHTYLEDDVADAVCVHGQASSGARDSLFWVRTSPGFE